MWNFPLWLGLLIPSILKTTITGPTKLPSNNEVCWLKTRKLMWADFQASTKPILAKEDSLPGSFLGATTEANAIVYDQVTNMGLYIGSIVSVRFAKSKSWVNKTDYFNRNDALVHEQLHFDIVELTGRKIRQRLASYATSPGRSYHSPEHDAEIGCLYDEESDLQLLFDQESKAGNDLKAQTRWQAYIQRELAKLRKFESTEKDCVTP